MRPTLGRIALAALLTAVTGSAQGLSNASLRGKFYFVQVSVTTTGAQSQEIRNTWGAITFDGNGGYTWSGKSAAGAAPPAQTGSPGEYTVSANGALSLPRFRIQGGLSGDGRVLLGAITDGTDNTQSLFVAIRAPNGSPQLAGAYLGSSLVFRTVAPQQTISSVATLTTDGAGTFIDIALVGHSSTRNERNLREHAGGTLYQVNPDGTGAAFFNNPTPLLTGDYDIFVSESGEYVLGCPMAAGTRGLFIAAKAPAPGQHLEGSYWIAELAAEGGNYSSAWGTLATMGGRALLSQRVRLGTRSIDYSGVNYYSLADDGTGSLTSRVNVAAGNLVLGPAGAIATGAQVEAVDSVTLRHGVFFLAKTPAIQGAGVFLHPAGAVNAASFAPSPNPIAPGQILALYGSGLAPRTASAPSLPLPTSLAGVTVTINNVSAPLFMVSAGQMNVQAPYGLTGSAATIRVSNNGASSQVVAPLAATSPGVFCNFAAAESPVRGIVLHTDWSAVTPSNPAYPGETVIMYVTGLGELTPSVASGAENPASPPSSVRDARLSVLFGGETAQRIWYAGGAPHFAGLNQINVDIPYTTPESDVTPVAIATPNAFADVAEIAVRRRR